MTPSADESSSIGATIIVLLGSFMSAHGGWDGFIAPTVVLSCFQTVPRCGFRMPRSCGLIGRHRGRRARVSPAWPPISSSRCSLPRIAPVKSSPNWRCTRRREYRSSGWSIRTNETVTIIAAGQPTRVVKQGDTLDGGDSFLASAYRSPRSSPERYRALSLRASRPSRPVWSVRQVSPASSVRRRSPFCRPAMRRCGRPRGASSAYGM